MTDHVFKVGDKGKTRGGDDYEVLWVGKERMMVSISGRELSYPLNGEYYEMGSEGMHDLIPPKRRIKGWYYFYSSGMACGPYDDRQPNADTEGLIGARYIDIEEGEGL